MASLNLETLNIERVRSAVAEQAIFEQGQRLYQWEQVQVNEVTDLEAKCIVTDLPRAYPVGITVADNYLYLKCDCRYAKRGLICEHEVAAALAVHAYLHQRQPARWKNQVTRVIDSVQGSPRRVHAQPYILIFSLQKVGLGTPPAWKISPYQLPLSALPKEARLAEAMAQGHNTQELFDLTPNLAVHLKSPYRVLNPAGCVNCPVESVFLANVLLSQANLYSYYYSGFPIQDYLGLIANTSSPLFYGTNTDPVQRSLKVLTDPGSLRASLTRNGKGLHLQMEIVAGKERFEVAGDERTPAVQIVSVQPLWVLAGRNLVRLDQTARADLLPALLENASITIPPEDESEFLEKFYLPLAESVPVQGDAVSWETISAEPVKRLYLSDTKGEIQVQLRFGYGPLEVTYDQRLPGESLLRKPDSWTLVRLQRKPEFETEAYQALSSKSYGLKRGSAGSHHGVFNLRARLHPIDFLLHNVPRLAADGFEIYGEEKLKTARVNRNKPTIAFRVSSGIDWFDVKASVHFGDLEVSMKDIQRVLRKKERFIKLADGTMGEIPAEWLEQYKHLFALGQDTKEGVRLSQHHVTLIDELLSGADEAQTDAAFEERRLRLRDFQGIASHELPACFTGELRPYQKAGYDWLHFLHEYDFGGCLADDMGLGKTIQALAFFQSLYECQQDGEVAASKNGHPHRPASLVVVPRSLLINWQREAGRFTPRMRILEYFETNRTQDLHSFDAYDLVITTYGVMLRDIEFLRQYTFYYVLLDESQTIKNSFTQTARAARQLKAKHRLVLTGTPVENSTLELWSQFSFLNPGLLGSLDYFKNEFGTPIEKKGDEKSANFLRKLVYPFILRRTKDQVAPELPPRTERVLYSDMEPAQRKLYTRTRDYYRGMLMGMIESEGLNNTRMKILEGLLRLRQISNHPLLADDKFRGESGKFDLLLETLDTLKAEGHKALVFSQFVSMLRIIRNELEVRHIPYTYLDGHTQNRQERVDEFQNNPKIPFFLISLKAGGLGLNLTAADYVIHVDPWWNPAVEMQASDRTHRIGQEKPVFVYKLITRDSVEEKILQLQEQKKDLVDKLIATESNFFKSLTPEDVKVLFS